MKKQKSNQECNDMNCPIHGSLSCRGRSFEGVILSTKMQKTATIEFPRRIFIAKYERYEKRRTKIKVHNPPCLGAKEGDIVKVMECKPLSKTKHFAIIGKIGAEKGFKEKMEAIEEGKFKKIEEKDEIS